MCAATLTSPAERALSRERFALVVDTREQRRYLFHDVDSIEAALDCGDYSVRGYTDTIRIERKGFDDLFGCLTSGRERFESQLERLERFPCRALILDTTPQALLIGHARCELPGHVALARLIELCAQYHVMPVFAGKDGAIVCQMLLIAFVKATHKLEGR